MHLQLQSHVEQGQGQQGHQGQGSRRSGTSSSREISNRIKAFFLSKRKAPEDVADLKQYLHDSRCEDSPTVLILNAFL